MVMRQAQRIPKLIMKKKKAIANDTYKNSKSTNISDKVLRSFFSATFLIDPLKSVDFAPTELLLLSEIFLSTYLSNYVSDLVEVFF